jgi:nucleoside-diphosphate-sugar epimerase
MIHALEQHLGKSAIIDYQPAIAADMQDTAADVSKAARLLEWTPSTSPIEEFRLTADWNRNEGEILDTIEL